MLQEENKRNHFEVSPQTGIIMEQISLRLEENGGFALIIDYGHEGEKTDTFRVTEKFIIQDLIHILHLLHAFTYIYIHFNFLKAFSQHSLHDPLIEPGTADLTADVDFSYLRKATGNRLFSLGPIPQRQFLSNMHIDVRLKVMIKLCKIKLDLYYYFFLYVGKVIIILLSTEAVGNTLQNRRKRTSYLRISYVNG